MQKQIEKELLGGLAFSVPYANEADRAYDMDTESEIYVSIIRAKKEIRKILALTNSTLDKYRNKPLKTETDKVVLRKILEKREPFEKISEILENERQKLKHICYK